MTIVTSRLPRCPVCGLELNGAVAQVIHGVAVCPDCIGAFEHDRYRVRTVLNDEVLNKHLTVARGVVFYVPKTFGPTEALRRYEAEAPDGLKHRYKHVDRDGELLSPEEIREIHELAPRRVHADNEAGSIGANGCTASHGVRSPD